jgi:hypothetical protein
MPNNVGKCRGQTDLDKRPALAGQPPETENPIRSRQYDCAARQEGPEIKIG